MCHMPHQAATTAIPPNPEKKLKIRIKPRPEFCIPVSIVMDLMSLEGLEKDFDTRNPRLKAEALWTKTRRNTNPI